MTTERTPMTTEHTTFYEAAPVKPVMVRRTDPMTD
jgi:hypothetical protein